MIFIGNGALLEKALTYTLTHHYKIDVVFSNSPAVEKLCNQHEIPCYPSTDINKKSTLFISADKIVFSIHNSELLREPILSLPGFKFYNIHNGIVPAYRGIPEVCIIYALLNQEAEYGVSLHAIDYGIDTGTCYGIKSFPITTQDTFQSLMLKGIEYCHTIFIENLDKALHNSLEAVDLSNRPSRLYTYKDLYAIHQYTDKELLGRALYFGVFKLWFKKAYGICKNQMREN